MAKQRFYHLDVPIEKTKLYDIPALEMAKQIIEKDPSEHFFISTLAEKVATFAAPRCASELCSARS